MADIETTDATGTDTQDVFRVARAWLAQDPDAETRAELEALIVSAEGGSDEALAELHDRFDTRLAFGTAGLRGRIEAGSARMNRVLVSQAAAGLAAYLLEREQKPSVVIGYDGRKNSAVFARDTAEIMAGAGVRAVLLPRLLPTPVLAFAVRHLDVSAGVMVTASHNPPADNGYKVYLGGEHEGSQIVSPSDAEIAAHITRVAAEQNVLELPRSDTFETAGEDLLDAYVAETAKVMTAKPVDLNVVYTAMHGVGWETFSRVAEAAGLATITPVEEQQHPDAAFPTVSFPNPEEPGALDLAYAKAREVGAELIVANDPDADRLSIAIPDPSNDEGYRQLSGNEVGWLLGWRAAVIHAEQSAPGGALACSIVSSPALAAVAREYDLDFVETLTGFKWVSRVPNLLFGYEEALGYLVNPTTVRDKDGISAATDFLSMVCFLREQGVTVERALEAFAEKFGYFASDQLSLRVTDLGDIAKIMAHLRAEPLQQLGGVKVNEIDDLIDGFGSLPATDALRFVLADGSRVMARPSGTEPKIKFYLDVQRPNEKRDEASVVLAAIKAELAEIAARVTA
ncbi:phospho-sugar mutase [Mycetocola zhadangensis]|uniref:Phospho-sugar mutase n=1 Tax=Mycetocola zhadangensis TaxID=1164595 RepID=A0A3L7IZU0_9MICO|nr:phospho-sugar mutase [Mycetocola zhadangensis]RLQ82522.1 phospho-sugar mutase [Mycetocola zhadangensis]GGF00537.1 phosphomannomutase [Mycetocola zhadangensis]